MSTYESNLWLLSRKVYYYTFSQKNNHSFFSSPSTKTTETTAGRGNLGKSGRSSVFIQATVEKKNEINLEVGGEKSLVNQVPRSGEAKPNKDFAEKKHGYGYHDRSLSIKKNFSKFVPVSGAFKYPKYAKIENYIENDDSLSKTNLFKFFFPKRPAPTAQLVIYLKGPSPHSILP
uniref:Uncharacterized protein n=1 Tax=Solanum lycopersicum TaxID=4081 RepID=A0A3Q7J7K4_SOLLC